ncbi:TPA: hypothetical protein QHS82_002246 [Escherichia coli]|nr:hypothetical protein [Escherichia coli]
MFEVNVMKDNQNQSLQVGDATIRIGDIFHTHWGYEQTNIEFYQVVSLHGKETVGLREIAREVVEHTSWCSAEIRPVPDKFIDEAIHKRRVIAKWGSVLVRFSDVTNAWRTSPEALHHCSWGY